MMNPNHDYNPEKERTLYDNNEIRITAETGKIQGCIFSFFRVYWKGGYIEGTNLLDALPQIITETRKRTGREISPMDPRIVPLFPDDPQKPEIKELFPKKRERKRK